MRGASRAAPPSRRAIGAPKVRLDEQRGERERAAQQRVVEHGHLDQQAADALGRRGGGLERGVGAERRAAHDRLVDLEVVEQRDRLAAEGGHRVVAHLRRAIRVAVAEQVEADDPMPALGERLRQGAVHLAGEEQPGQEHHEAPAAAVLVVHQPVSVELEVARRGFHVRVSL